ncbi:hypothetical protein ACFL1B_01585 [Nanoarchaeota archaeon]
MRSTRIEPALGTERASAIDKRIALKVEGFEYDAEEVAKQRAQSRSTIDKLQRALKRAENRELPELEHRTVTEMRTFEKATKRQLQDIMKIITWLRDLIEEEYIQIIYDIRQPMVILERFIEELKPLFQKVQFKQETQVYLKDILDSITKEFDNLLDLVTGFLDKTFSIFNKLGVSMEKVSLKARSDYSLAVQLQQRAKLKQQINGKTQWIVSQLARLEAMLRELRDTRKYNTAQINQAIKNIAYFRKQYLELVQMCVTRAEASGHMIAEAITIQKDKLKELDQLKAKLKSFYEEFRKEQEELAEKHGSAHIRTHAGKRVDEFGKYQEEVMQELDEFEKDFDRDMATAKKKDLRQLRQEKRELRVTKRRVSRLRTAVRRTVYSGMVALALMGNMARSVASANEPYLTQKQYIESTARQFTNIMDPDVVKNLIAFTTNSEAVEEINKRNEELNREVDQRELTKEEIDYIKAQLESFGVGGFVRGFGPSPLIIARYAKNVKGVLELPGNIYQESHAVNYMQNLLTRNVLTHVLAGETRGTIKSTDRGVITEKKIFKSASGEHDGQINLNGYLVSPMGSKLHYTDNSYPLYAHFEVHGNSIQIKFEIPTQKYDYANSPAGAVSEISTPSGATLKIPDHLLGVLEGKGVFHAVEYTSNWDEVVNVNAAPNDFPLE